MTIADKIKYCRMKQGITQAQLAELSGIHPVSIRKYETGKMVPQPEQLHKIAEALGISYVALLGVRNTGLKLETVGDLFGVLMTLLETNVLQMVGVRPDGVNLTEQTYVMRFNPLIDNYMAVDTESEANIPLSKIQLTIQNGQFLHDLLQWENSHVIEQMEVEKSGGKYTEDILRFYGQMELNELELMRTNRMLDTSNGISVRMPHKVEKKEK